MAFTVGLWHTHRLPELAIFGLDSHVMKTCLNLTAGQFLVGTSAATETRAEGALTGYLVLLKTTNPAWHHAFFGTALGFYQAAPSPAVPPSAPA
jgi:hypothetical protein